LAAVKHLGFETKQIMCLPMKFVKSGISPLFRRSAIPKVL